MNLKSEWRKIIEDYKTRGGLPPLKTQIILSNWEKPILCA